MQLCISSNEYLNATGNFARFDSGQDTGTVEIQDGSVVLRTGSGATSSARLEVTSDGRGLSQFTAKAWVRFDQVADSVLDSHNVSGVDDDATGEFTVNFTNNMANINYAGIGMSEDDRFMTSHGSTRPAVGAMKFQCTHYNGSRYDEDNNACLFFGD